MRTILILLAAVLLCSCASDGGFTPARTSVSFGGQSMPTMDLADPHFYMDDDAAPPDYAAPAGMAPGYGVDNFCSSDCQRRGGSPGYCSRVCGF